MGGGWFGEAPHARLLFLTYKLAQARVRPPGLGLDGNRPPGRGKRGAINQAFWTP